MTLVEKSCDKSNDMSCDKGYDNNDDRQYDGQMEFPFIIIGLQAPMYYRYSRYLHLVLLNQLFSYMSY